MPFTPICSSAATSSPSSTSASANGPELMLLAPATANTIGKMANGIGDDLLSSVLLTAAAPVLLAPAMEEGMLENPHVQRNARLLRQQGVGWIETGDRGAGVGGARQGTHGEPGGRRRRGGGFSRVAPGAGVRVSRGTSQGSRCWSPRARPARTSIPSASSAIARPERWGTPSLPGLPAGGPR